MVGLPATGSRKFCFHRRHFFGSCAPYHYSVLSKSFWEEIEFGGLIGFIEVGFARQDFA